MSSIASVIDSIKALSAKQDFKLETKLHCEWQRGVEYGGISAHTTLTGLLYKAQWRGDFGLTVILTHKCPIGSFREKVISKAPYYCKQCAQCIISADQAASFCLPLDTTVVPKIQISLASPSYKRDPKTDYDIGDMVLTQNDGWVHKCSKLSTANTSWPVTKQTLKSLPFKCKLCRKQICEEGMTFEKLANMAKILGVFSK